MSANHSTLLKSGESGDFQHLIYIFENIIWYELKILFDMNWKYYLILIENIIWYEFIFSESFAAHLAKHPQSVFSYHQPDCFRI